MRNPELSTGTQEQLRCPVCRGKLRTADATFLCTRSDCAARFPVVDGVPILLNEARSVFSTSDFLLRRDTTFQLHRNRVERLLHGLLDLLPDISGSVGAKRNYASFTDSLLQQTPAPKVLIIGGSILGEGMTPLTINPAFELIATDVSFGPLTVLVCDAHDIPFDDETFDGVVVQAVLEHVVDPYRCVGEIHRVLKKQGMIYAETPFMQQVHMGRHDFTRFTHSGHRRLFRHFDEISSGAIGGPGMALAWSYEHFLLSFATSRTLRGLARAFARLTAFYLKYFDYYLIDQPGALDAASGFFFMGRKGGRTLSDRELIGYYKGADSRRTGSTSVAANRPTEPARATALDIPVH
jgi:SAM-dependent methyltransferase